MNKVAKIHAQEPVPTLSPARADLRDHLARLHEAGAACAAAQAPLNKLAELRKAVDEAQAKVSAIEAEHAAAVARWAAAGDATPAPVSGHDLDEARTALQRAEQDAATAVAVAGQFQAVLSDSQRQLMALAANTRGFTRNVQYEDALILITDATELLNRLEYLLARLFGLHASWCDEGRRQGDQAAFHIAEKFITGPLQSLRRSGIRAPVADEIAAASRWSAQATALVSDPQAKF